MYGSTSAQNSAISAENNPKKYLESLPIIQKHPSFRAYGAVALFYNYVKHDHIHSDRDNCESCKAMASGKQRRLALPLLAVTPPSLSSSITSVSEVEPQKQRSRGSSLGSLKMVLQHSPAGSLLHLPGFATPSSASDPGSAGSGSSRRFSFSLRRFSSQALPTHDPAMSAAGQRTLVSLITEDDLPGMLTLLEAHKVSVDDRDENNTTALQVAASKGKLAFVRELINVGADVNSEDNDNWTALICAAKEGHADVCAYLLDCGADIEHRDMGGWTSLMWSCYKGRAEAAQLLMEKNADVHAQGNYHISCLIWAAGRGHPEILHQLLEHGAKAVTADKYGTSALVWASRQGNPESVSLLLKAGANVDAVGMYSWTALLVATVGGHSEVVTLLLKAKANINAKDKDGCTALAVASKEGFEDIVVALLNEGAYINIQDRNGDTSLIHAVKGGHRPAVEALLKKYADPNITGKDRKTALYWAVEKGNYAMVKLILGVNPDLEIATKDGDTALLKAVRNRSTEIVQLLLDKKAKVHAADKKGDTCLHIAMRARAKAVVEVLLRNPKNSQLLYRPNKNGETPYNLDMKHPKTILGQIFGQRRLNTSQENEKLLGYDLYSCALADIMSDPLLTMPITVGLFAKWGSGKSFLLNKLKEEMMAFAQQWVTPTFSFSPLVLLLLCHLALLVGVCSGLGAGSWIVGSSVGVGAMALSYVILAFIWYGARRMDLNWPYNLSIYLAHRLARIKLVLQVLFCHPAAPNAESTNANPIRFYFTEQAKVSSSAGGESCLLHMLGSLYDAIEKDYGTWAPRLYRAFRPQPVDAGSPWQWRRLCCLPYCVLWLVLYVCGLMLAVALFLWLQVPSQDDLVESYALQAIVISLSLILSVAVVANLFTVGRAFQALVLSQRTQLNRAVAKLGSLKNEGFMHQLKGEVQLMTSLVECLDSFSAQQTRLVAIVDGLDSAEQDRVLQVLDAVDVLFNENGAPFIVVLAIDPHIIAKALDCNTQRVFSEGNISGHSYVRNLVHLPFFLQNSAMNRAKVAQQHAARRMLGSSRSEPDDTMIAVSRRLSNESSSGVGDRLKAPPGPGGSRKGSSNMRRLWPSESVASSLASNLNRAGTGFEPSSSKGFMLTDDYFSDVTPRAMRRLMNIVFITSRLLRSFQVEFNFYHLATWVNLSEQWPYRLSWIVLYFDIFDESLDDSKAIKSIYEKVRPFVPTSKDTEPLLELDRDEKKLEIFLSNHRANLLVYHLRLFLPFTINLDPYLKKVIKEENVGLEEMFTAPGQQQQQLIPTTAPSSWTPGWNTNKPVMRRQRSALRIAPSPAPTTAAPMAYPPTMPQNTVMGWPPAQAQPALNWEQPVMMTRALPPPPALLHDDIRLSSLSVEGICDVLPRVEELSTATVASIQAALKENNIGGKVLSLCELNDLKQVLKLSFGDWEIFKWMISALRQQETASIMSSHGEDSSARNVRFAAPIPQERKGSASSSKSGISGDKEKSRIESRPKQTLLEKQVSVEEQMICGALQTLSEEACEDVLEEPVEMLRSSTRAKEEEIISGGTPGSNRRLLRAPADPIIRKRPVSLLVAAPQEELSFPDYITPPASPRRLASLRKSVIPGSNTVTPTSSLERLKDRLLRSVARNKPEEEGDEQLSDESTPLVSELSTPIALIPPVTMTLASPPQPSSSESSASSSVSLTQVLETPGEQMTRLSLDSGGGGGQASPHVLPETQV